MDKQGIIIIVVLILIMGGYLAVKGGFPHTIREGLTQKKTIHWVSNCSQCGRAWCGRGGVISQEEANTLYNAGSPLSQWGCDKIPSDYEQVSIEQVGGPIGSIANGGVFVIEPTPAKEPKGGWHWWNIKNENDCITAGGSSYAECAADGTQYCAGPCTGPGHKCMISAGTSPVATAYKQELKEIYPWLRFNTAWINAMVAEKFPTAWNGLEWNACINPGAPSSGVKANNPYATASTMTCPPEYPYLLEYANGDKWCYENGDGNTTGEGGLCNCNCQDCGFNSNFPNCTELGDQYSCQTCNNLYNDGPTAEATSENIGGCGCQATSEGDSAAELRGFGFPESTLEPGNRWCWLSDGGGTVEQQKAKCLKSPGCMVAGNPEIAWQGGCVTRNAV